MLTINDAEADSATPPEPTPPRRSRTRLVIVGLVLGAVLLAAGAFGLSRSNDDDVPPTPVADSRTISAPVRLDGTSMADQVDDLVARVADVPGDHVALATLGIAYVQQARITGDATLYSLADDALDRSFAVNDDDNFLAETGRAAVAAARHDFRTAERHAVAGLEINPFNSTLWGVLSDAQIQLGKYDAGFESVDRMGELSPDIASITRAAYVDELRGDDAGAQQLMERALREAFSADDRAFALFQLGELEMGAGRPEAALPIFLDALEASPNDISAMSGKAHALSQTGEIEAASTAYEELLDAAPLADFMIEYGEFLDGEGQADEAAEWYERARAQIELDRESGVLPDAGLLFFEADHGDVEVALDQAAAAVAERPFFELHEAHGWALYRNGRFDEAASALDEAMELGINDPELFVRFALVQHALGNDTAASEALTTATEINPLGVPYLTPSDESALAEISG